MKKKALIIGIIGIFLHIQPMSAQTWEKTKRLTWNIGLSSHQKIATDSNGHIHVVWQDNSPGNNEIYYKRSSNGGITWSLKRLTMTSGSSIHPAVAVDASDNIHVSWVDQTTGNYEIYYKRSMNAGATWGGTKRITWNSGHSVEPAIATKSNNVHLVWHDNPTGNYEIYYKRSTNAGGTWGGTKRITWNAGDSSYSSIAGDSGSNIHVVWEDNTPGNMEIYYKKSTNGGVNWGKFKRLAWSSGASTSPKITVDSSDGISLVWSDDTPGNKEIYYRRSTSGGVTWSSTKRLTWNSGASAGPAITVDSSNGIYIVWYDDTPGRHEIYYKRSTNSGETWGGFKRLTWNSEWGEFYPDFALDSSNTIHVVWHDGDHGNTEIYYKKGGQ